MSARLVARRSAAVGFSLVLTLGVSGVAASAAFADAPVSPGTTQTDDTADDTAEDVDTPEAVYTLIDNGSGSFTLALAVPGTAIAIDYTVDTTGAVTTASTSTADATVEVDGHELTVTLADGRTIEVELGDAGDSVREVSVEDQDGEESEDASQDSEDADEQDDADTDTGEADDSSNADEHADANDEQDATSGSTSDHDVEGDVGAEDDSDSTSGSDD